MNERKFVKPLLEIVEINPQDIIVTSYKTGETKEGQDPFKGLTSFEALMSIR